MFSEDKLLLTEPTTQKFQTHEKKTKSNFGLYFYQKYEKCKRRSVSYFNNVFSKEVLFSEDKWPLTEPTTEKFQKRDKWKRSNFVLYFHQKYKKCKRRAFSYFNNIFSKEGLFSEDKWPLTEPKTEKCQKRDKGTKTNFGFYFHQIY